MCILSKFILSKFSPQGPKCEIPIQCAEAAVKSVVLQCFNARQQQTCAYTPEPQRTPQESQNHTANRQSSRYQWLSHTRPQEAQMLEMYTQTRATKQTEYLERWGGKKTNLSCSCKHKSPHCALILSKYLEFPLIKHFNFKTDLELTAIPGMDR